MKNVRKSTKHILLVDDNLDVRDIMRLLLEDSGYRVTATDSGSEAIRIFSINPGYFDLIILDEDMPGLKGTDVAPRMVGLCSTVRIVLYTGCLEDDLVEKAQKAGIREVISKPLSIELLLELIERNSNGGTVSRRRTGRRADPHKLAPCL